MSRYIDADNFMKVLEEDVQITDNPIEVMVSVIATLEEQPTADVVEVVRCKDCKHRIYDGSRDLYYCNIYYGMGDVSNNNYCNYGERKES